MKEEDPRFPVNYNGKWYNTPEDCDPDFLPWYGCKEAMYPNGGCYLGESVFIFPDGDIKVDNEY